MAQGRERERVADMSEDVTATPPDRNMRLHRLVAKKAPSAQLREDGTWPGGRCPYVIVTLPDGDRQVRITDPETGDSVGAKGATLDDALTALEAKAGIATGGA